MLVGYSPEHTNQIYHNNFINNTNQASVTVGYENVWDDGYPSGGNYWSDYTGLDLYSGPYQNETGSDGIGDTPHIIDANNRDSYPLMYPYGTETFKLIITTTTGGTTNPQPGTYIHPAGAIVNVTAFPNTGYSFDYWLLDGNVRTENPITVIMDANHTLEAHFIDVAQPIIDKPHQWPPPNEVEPDMAVLVYVNVTDRESGVNKTILSYTIDNGLTWNNITMELVCYLPCDKWFYIAEIPGMPANTLVKYKIIAYDNAGNYAIEDNAGQYYVYTVIPEYPSTGLRINHADNLIHNSPFEDKKKAPTS